ncbi:M23 family metallopeptidase [uncultured Arcobacter sp.]|uniref:M23 family metallopeptidase n=1 Tax=uncultured Arcobacter sp. TaxID=165434 RepID=UPI002609B956|nr:M23 family metallopeptidase [uncultured Arcobacter sp.]
MRSKSNFGKILFFIFLVAGFAAGGFVYLSPMFEKNPPKVKFNDNIYWNLKSKLNLTISDDSGIKFYKVIFKDGNKDIVLDTQVLIESEKVVDLELKAPELDMFFKSTDVQIIVEAIDRSKWNFLEGNKVVKTFNLKIDRKKPEASVITNSFAVRRGGSALVIVKVEDENLKDSYISFNNEQRFDLIPFYKDNYYASLIAWPITMEDFSIVNLIAIDKADNKSITKVPLYIRKLKEKRSKIRISDSFIQNVSTKVLDQSGKEIPNDLVETFIKQNKLLRSQNVAKIEEVSKKYMDKELVNEFDITPFKRLTNAATAGQFGQKRSYYHDNIKIDEAWHLGVDWASIKKADIFTTNKARVIFNDYLGIYGNTIILDHGFGLQTLYAHTSASNVAVGEKVEVNQKIGNTGVSGAVLGDHLHFGVLIQGIEVDPLEWMDKNWIKTRITDILDEAKKVIDNK